MEIHFLIDLIKNYGYFIIFFGALSEAIPLLGIIVPGQTIVIIGGLLSNYLLNLHIVLMLSIIGTVIGDLVSYLLGLFYGERVERFLNNLIYRFFNNKGEKTYKSIKRLFKNNSIKVIIFSKIHSLTRAFVPFIAGLEKINPLKFIILDSITSLIFVGSLVTLGFLVKEAIHKLIKDISILSTSLLLIIIILFLIYIIDFDKTFIKLKKGIFININKGFRRKKS